MTERLTKSAPCPACFEPITQLSPVYGQGEADPTTPHHFGPRPRGTTAVGGGEDATREGGGGGSLAFASSQESNASIQLTPPPAPVSPSRSLRRRRSQRTASAVASVMLNREYSTVIRLICNILINCR